MKTALLHFADGRTVTQEVTTMPWPRSIEVNRGGISLITRTFALRVGQSGEGDAADYDEVVTVESL